MWCTTLSQLTLTPASSLTSKMLTCPHPAMDSCDLRAQWGSTSTVPNAKCVALPHKRWPCHWRSAPGPSNCPGHAGCPCTAALQHKGCLTASEVLTLIYHHPQSSTTVTHGLPGVIMQQDLSESAVLLTIHMSCSNLAWTSFFRKKKISHRV